VGGRPLRCRRTDQGGQQNRRNKSEANTHEWH
jgi:hypothetical protein